MVKKVVKKFLSDGEIEEAIQEMSKELMYSIVGRLNIHKIEGNANVAVASIVAEDSRERVYDAFFLIWKDKSWQVKCKEIMTYQIASLKNAFQKEDEIVVEISGGGSSPRKFLFPISKLNLEKGEK